MKNRAFMLRRRKLLVVNRGEDTLTRKLQQCAFVLVIQMHEAVTARNIDTTKVIRQPLTIKEAVTVVGHSD